MAFRTWRPNVIGAVRFGRLRICGVADALVPAENRHRRASRTRAATPALLKGLIFGPDGRAMAPSHTRKRGRLYRFYRTTTALKLGHDACPIRSDEVIE